MRIIDADLYAAELRKLRESYQILDDTNAVDKERLFKLHIMHGIFRAEQALKEQPTVDAVPVEWIRGFADRIRVKGWAVCAAVMEGMMELYLESYCADGKRKQ